MTDNENLSPKKRRPKLNESERTMIEYLWNVEQLSQSEIGKRLNRSQSVIARELQSGNTLDYSHFTRPELLRLPIHVRIKYSAARGQYNSVKKAFRFGQGSKLTPELKAQVEHWINDEKWTPEQVAADIEDVDISASTIRQWARRKDIDIKVSHYKATSKAERERNKSLREKEIEISRLRSQLRDSGELARHSIYERPETVNKRKQFGHWEIDLVLPAKGNEKTILDPSAIMTIVERKTRFFALYKIRSRRSVDVIAGLDLFWKDYGELVRSITSDNGIEFSSWAFLEHVQKELGTKMYYSTPSSPHERGTNERKNRELRKYLPKGQTFFKINQQKLDEIASKINRKPMLKALNGRSPVELFEVEYCKFSRYKRAYAKRKQKLMDELKNER